MRSWLLAPRWEDPDLITKVGTLIERYRMLGDGGATYGRRGRQARAALEAEGFTPAVIAEATALLMRVLMPPRAAEVDAAERAAATAAALEAVWAWYEPWSGLAQALKERGLLPDPDDLADDRPFAMDDIMCIPLDEACPRAQLVTMRAPRPSRRL